MLSRITKGYGQLKSLSFFATTPSKTLFERIGMSYTTHSYAKHRVLHLVGFGKLRVLERAVKLEDYLVMPIFAFLQESLAIYWSP